VLEAVGNDFHPRFSARSRRHIVDARHGAAVCFDLESITPIGSLLQNLAPHAPSSSGTSISLGTAGALFARPGH
jgi:hypothetical protein